MASYDWRLPLDELERRDEYFSRLRHEIELLRATHGRPAAIFAHSMGATVALHFLQWVERPREDGGGGGGPGWVAAHVRDLAMIGGSLLGSAKAVTAVLSGQLRDTAAFGDGLLRSMQDLVFEQQDIARFFRSLGSLPLLFPKGGDVVWGTATSAPDDVPAPKGMEPRLGSLGALLTLDYPGLAATAGNTTGAEAAADGLWPMYNILAEAVRGEDELAAAARHNFSFDGTLGLLRLVAPRYMQLVDARYSFGAEPPASPGPREWHNPLQAPLPAAPGLRLWCMYGVGKATERAYWLRRGSAADRAGPTPLPFVLNASAHDAASGLEQGVQLADGDGTVPLLSLGYMCARGWRRGGALNPSNASAAVREYRHEPAMGGADGAPIDEALRGGRRTADHVDIMGNVELLADLLAIATRPPPGGEHPLPAERVMSNIFQHAARVGAPLA